MKNKLLIFGIVLLIVLQIGSFVFVQAQVPEIENAEGVLITYEGDDIWKVSFDAKDSYADIEGNIIKNVLPASESLNPSFIKVNAKNEIIEADLTADKLGGDYWINGVKFHLDSGERVYYNGKENKFYPDKSVAFPEIDDLALEKGFFIEGQRINMGRGIIIDGEAFIDKRGHLIKSGSAVYNNKKLFIIDEPVLIANSETDLSDYHGDWIRQKKGILELKSSEIGTIYLEFLENSLKSVEKNDKLSVRVMNGDGLEVKTKVIGDLILPEFTHKSSETGNTLIENDGLDFKFNNENLIIDSYSVKIDDILSKKYGSAEIFIASDSEKILGKNKIKVDNFGTAYAFLEDPSKELYSYENSRNLKGILEVKEEFGEDGLEKIAQALKDNAGNKADAIINAFAFDSNFIYDLPWVLGEGSEAGFNKDETLSLIIKTIEIQGDESSGESLNLYSALSEMNDYKIPKSQMRDFILTTNEKLKDADSVPFFKEISRELLPNALNSGVDLELTGEFIDKMIESKMITKGGFRGYYYGHYSASVKDYNGKNFQEIKNGVELAGKYDTNPWVLKNSNIHYTDIKDKRSLAKSYASAMNDHVKKEKEYDSSYEGYFIMDINRMHDAELTENKDELRETIIKDLSIKSKYDLISIAGGEMYPSTFGKIYDSFPSNLLEQIKQIDPKGESLDSFTFQLASRSKLNDLMEEDSVFVKDFIKRQLLVKEDEEGFIDEEKLLENAIFATNTLDDFYKDPKYQNEKKDLENFLIKNYNEAKTKGQKEKQGTYGYLLKLNENPLTEEVKKISKELPEIPKDLTIPKRYSDKKEIAAKLYYYDDEAWFEESAKEFKTKYGMNLIRSTDNEAILTQEVGEKNIKINLERVSRTTFPENKEILESDQYQIVAHRGHCFYLDQTFSEGSYTDKMLFAGSCGSYESVPELQKRYPNAQIISDKDIGKGAVNDLVIYNLLKDIAKGKKDWKELKPEFTENEGLVFPDDSSMLIRKYIAQF